MLLTASLHQLTPNMKKYVLLPYTYQQQEISTMSAEPSESTYATGSAFASRKLHTQLYVEEKNKMMTVKISKLVNIASCCFYKTSIKRHHELTQNQKKVKIGHNANYQQSDLIFLYLSDLKYWCIKNT
jgi:hypothetical protein